MNSNSFPSTATDISSLLSGNYQNHLIYKFQFFLVLGHSAIVFPMINFASEMYLRYFDQDAP